MDSLHGYLLAAEYCYKNRVDEIFNLNSEKNKSLTVINDQFGSPTYSINLAKLIFTDRAKRKWTVFLQRGDAIKAQEHFYNVQSQQTRQKYQSHNDLTRR